MVTNSYVTPSAEESRQYFDSISNALAIAGRHYPTLVIDKERLDYNLNQLMQVIDQGFAYRIVAKSLPSIPMLRYIMQRTGTNRLMSFHLPFVCHVVKHIPQADILLGKPMPVAAARQFYQWFSQQPKSDFDPAVQLHWLVDSEARLKQYAELGAELKLNINVSLELDIGLHRGGYNDKQAVRNNVELIQASQSLTLTGVMGYEAHVSKIPGFLGGATVAFKQAMQRYEQFVDVIAQVIGTEATQSLILNAGGSSTYKLYGDAISPVIRANEIATASALVKPTDFDVVTLDHHQPAAFIATPVLKVVKNPDIPSASLLSKLQRVVGASPRNACFVYGGNWLATPCYPQASKRANIFGHSSNQELYELEDDSAIAMDDFFFFRPTQSEAVMLQFGELAVYENGKIVENWSVFEAEKLTS